MHADELGEARTMTILYSLLGNRYCINELKSCPIPTPLLLRDL